MSTLTATAFQPDNLLWRRLGFQPTTPRVSKRQRPDGLFDVVYREVSGYYSAWIAEASSIWLVVQELVTFEPPLDIDDLHNLLRHFPPDPIAHPQRKPFQSTLFCAPYEYHSREAPALPIGSATAHGSQPTPQDEGAPSSAEPE